MMKKTQPTHHNASITLTQWNLIGMFVGVLLLSLTIYKWDMFNGNYYTILVYKTLIPVSFLLLFASFFRLLRLPFWIGLVACFLLEGTAYWYIRHVIEHNQAEKMQDIGILQKWLSYRDAIQFDNRFSQYDSLTIYKFQYGINRQFTDLEFDTQIISNSMGLRDDERSLSSPKMIFLGDSFTMGWGVNQEDTYVQKTEKTLNTKALNAGVSSYGTYREALMLRKLQADSCKLLVIQYCENDLEENHVRGDSLKTTVAITPDLYTKITSGNTINSGYFPMRFSYFFLREKEFIKRILIPHSGVKKDFLAWCKEMSQYVTHTNFKLNAATPKKPEGDPKTHAHYFFKSLQLIRQIYKGPIIITDIDPRNTNPWYMDAFRQEAQHMTDPKLYFVALDKALSPDCYFVVDDHINAKGHQKVATVLVDFILKNKLLE